MNRLMLASLSVFALAITAPSMQDATVATSPAGDLNSQDPTTVDSSHVTSC